MDRETYWKLRMSDTPVRREDAEEIIGTSDVGVLLPMMGDLKTGRINYINLELCNKAAERILDLSSDKGIRAQAYGHLIDYELSHGRSYRGLFEKALDEGVEPEFPLYRNDTDIESINKRKAGAPEDFDAIIKRMADGRPERHIVEDTELMSEALRIIEGYEHKKQVESIIELSPYYAGNEYDERMKAILTDALGHVGYEDFDLCHISDIHDTIESLYGIKEHDWLIQSTIRGNIDDMDELNWRMPNVESEWRGRYLDAFREIIRKGWAIRYSQYPYLYSVDILPEEVLDYAMDCCENPFIGNEGDVNCRRSSAYELASEISKRCFVSGRYEEAYRYALKSRNHELYPLVYTMLMDGLGVDRDEDAAIRLVKEKRLPSVESEDD